MRMNIDGNLNIKHVGFLFSPSSVTEILKLTLNLYFSSLLLWQSVTEEIEKKKVQLIIDNLINRQEQLWAFVDFDHRKLDYVMISIYEQQQLNAYFPSTKLNNVNI